jgi:hypothetical protein
MKLRLTVGGLILGVGLVQVFTGNYKWGLIDILLAMPWFIDR